MARPVGRKWSEFNSVTEITGSASICVVENGQNVTITADNFFTQFVAADINSVGTGVPVVDIAGSQYNVRALESGGGIDVSVGPTNNIILRSAIENTTEGGAKVFVDDTAVPLVARSFEGTDGISVTASGGTITIGGTLVPTATKTVIVNDVSDFPAPVSGVITLADDTVYLIGDTVDVTTNTFVVGNNTVVTGDSSLVAGLTGTASGNIFDESTGGNFGISNLTLDFPNGTVFAVSSASPKTGLFSVSRSRVLDCTKVADVNNAKLFLVQDLEVVTCTDVFTVSGTNAVLNIDSVLVQSFTGTGLDLNGSVTDIINIDNITATSGNPAAVPIAGLTNSGNIAVGGVGNLIRVNILGTYTSSGDILPSDLRWNISGSNVLADTRTLGLATMTTNATATTVVDGVDVLFAGTFTSQIADRFTISAAGRMTYDGFKDIDATITATFAVTKPASGSDTYYFFVGKNGSVISYARAERTLSAGQTGSISIASAIPLSEGDYVELFVRGVGTSDPVTFTSVNFLVEA